MKIESLIAKKILDSRGKHTVRVDMITNKGAFTAEAPSGTSSGRHEALEVDVEKAIYNVSKTIAPKLLEKKYSSQKEVDDILIDLSGPNKEKMGVNAVLPVSVACCRGLAKDNNLSVYSYIAKLSERRTITTMILPRPCVLLFEGSLHAAHSEGSGQASKMDVQEFMVIGDAGSFKENYQITTQVYQALEKILVKEFGEDGIQQGLEGGFSPIFNKTEQALDLIMQAIKSTPYDGKVKIGLDVAASEFWESGRYNFEGKLRDVNELAKFYQGLVSKYPILFIEDPFAEDDLDGWKETKELRHSGVLVVGDDLIVTNKRRMAMAFEQNLCNAVILKPNQIGTVTETIDASNMAEEYNWKRIVSHRSGDTTDDFISDLAVGIGAEFIKSGGPTEKERKAKYDRLLAIAKEI